MANNDTPIVVADFETQLASAISATDTSFTLSSVTDDDGNDLGDGLYAFTIDNGSSNKEYLIGTLTSATKTVASVKTVTRKGVESSGAARAHRVGAPVIITDHVALQRVSGLLRGDLALDADTPLIYDANPTISDDKELATKKYVDDTVSVPDASTTVKGIVEEATQAQVDARTATGETGARLFVNPETVRGILYHDYAADAGSDDSYAITVTPAPASYTTGDVYVFEANTANTGAATLNVNSLGAVTLKRQGADLLTGDITAGQIVACVYDGTNMQLISAAPAPKFSGGQFEKNIADASTTQNVAHSLGRIPKRIQFSYVVNGSGSRTCYGNGCFVAPSTHTTTVTVIDVSAPSTTYSYSATEDIVMFQPDSSNKHVGVVTAIDATNFTITWTKTGSPTGTAAIIWTAEA